MLNLLSWVQVGTDKTLKAGPVNLRQQGHCTQTDSSSLREITEHHSPDIAFLTQRLYANAVRQWHPS